MMMVVVAVMAFHRPAQGLQRLAQIFIRLGQLLQGLFHGLGRLMLPRIFGHCQPLLKFMLVAVAVFKPMGDEDP